MSFCSECNIELNENNDCPICKKHYVFIEESISAIDGFGLKAKDPNYKSKRHPYSVTMFERVELNRDRNLLVKRFKKEDRINNEYEEVIQTLEGEVFVNKKEPLRNHVNHGNAKKGNESV
ncbi:MAG: hypothetical protein R3Y47_12965 [Lachnospiraceae bacterium]